ncbi:hypothetical protein ACF0H5_013803 [Mactra antiquata]
MGTTSVNKMNATTSTSVTFRLSTTEKTTTIKDVEPTSTIFNFDTYMFEIMGAVLGIVVFIVVLIVVVFVVKSQRRRRHNRRVFRNNQQPEARESRDNYNSCVTQDNVGRVQSTHQPLYGQPFPTFGRDNINPSVINGVSAATNNIEYVNREVTVAVGAKYDITRQKSCDKSHMSPKFQYCNERDQNDLVATIKVHMSPRQDRRVDDMYAKTEIGKMPLKQRANTASNNGERLIERKQSLRTYGKKEFDSNQVKESPGNDSVVRNSSDYENSPKTLRELKLQQAKNLKCVSPANSSQMVRESSPTTRTSKSPNNVKKYTLVKQSSEYEDPDKVVAMRKKSTENKQNEGHEYSNLIMPGLVVKSERFPDASDPGDYENKHVIENLRLTAPPLPVKRAHTSNLYDRPRRPIVKVRNRTYSDRLPTDEDDDMYIPMDGSLIEEDKYIAMNLDDTLHDSSNDKTENTNETKVKVDSPKIKPALLPKPMKRGTQTQLINQATMLSIMPPPCGNRLLSHAGYANFDEDSRYINLFRSKSNDDLYVYADTKP